jgi:hypothetical protein
MDSERVNYSTGDPVHVGDRVQYRGTFAKVVFVTDGDESETWPGYEGYSGYDRGLVICDDDDTTTVLNETDEELVLVSRASCI